MNETAPTLTVRGFGWGRWRGKGRVSSGRGVCNFRDGGERGMQLWGVEGGGVDIWGLPGDGACHI